MSERSLIILLFLAASVTSLAQAQERTPTNPLDAPGLIPRGPVEAPPPTNVPPSTPPVPNSGVTPPPRIALPSASGAVATVALGDLLPASVTQANGLSERDVVLRAREVGLGSRRAAARERAAEAGVTATRRGFIPNVVGSFRYTRLSDYTPGTIAFFNTPGCIADLPACQADPASFQQNVILQQAILNQYAVRVQVSSRLSDLVGAQRHALRAAEAEAEAAQAYAVAARQDVELLAMQSFWEVVRARAQLELAGEASSVAQRRAQEAAARESVGAVTATERTMIEAQSAGYTRLVSVAEARRDIAEITLRDLLEMEPGEALNLAANLEALPTPQIADPETLRRDSADTPGVRSALASARAADARADMQRSQLYPALSVGFNLDYANPNQRIFPQEQVFTATWDANVSVSWSPDAAFTTSARLDQQRALAEEQRLAAEEQRRAASVSALQARGQLVSAVATVEAQHASASAASLAAENAVARRDAGVSTDLQVQDAESARLSARLDLVDALVDAHIAQAQLRRAAGQSPLSEENR